jgi:hypothetical protein
MLDRLETLTYVATNTNKIALGTSVIDMLFHNPVVLARRCTTLDVLSEEGLFNSYNFFSFSSINMLHISIAEYHQCFDFLFVYLNGHVILLLPSK